MCRNWSAARSAPTSAALALLNVIRRKGIDAIL
jgi:DNA-binding transcriptional regulator YiaG